MQQRQPGFVANREEAAERVERLLGYTFNDRALLEEALTHSLHPTASAGRATYQRLEFIGDAALGLAFATLFYREKNPPLHQGELTVLRSANTAEEKFARVAVRHGLYDLVHRYNCDDLDRNVSHFIESVSGTVPYNGDLKAPKVLPDIVEAIAGAVYVDCQYDIEKLTEVAVLFCDPIITKEKLFKDPVLMLNELGPDQRKELVSVLKVPVTLDELGNVIVGEEEQVSTSGLGNGSENEVGDITILRVED